MLRLLRFLLLNQSNQRPKRLQVREIFAQGPKDLALSNLILVGRTYQENTSFDL